MVQPQLNQGRAVWTADLRPGQGPTAPREPPMPSHLSGLSANRAGLSQEVSRGFQGSGVFTARQRNAGPSDHLVPQM